MREGGNLRGLLPATFDRLLRILITHRPATMLRALLMETEARRIHVLVLTPLYPFQGDEADGCYIAESLKYLPEFNIDLTVIAAKPWTGARIKADPRVTAARWVHFPYVPGRMGWYGWGLALYARIGGSIVRLHRKHKIDLIHAHCALPCGHPAALLSRRLKIPFVVTTHGLDAFCRTLGSNFSQRWCERWSRFVYERAAQNICVSEAVRRVIEAGLSPVSTTVIHNGVDTELFSPATNGTPSAVPTVLCVARLVSDKGHELVLRAIAHLNEKYPDLRYESIDDGPDRGRFMKLCRELKIDDRVQFHGRRSRHEIAAAMKRCTVFAMPSPNEALGCVYLEAMASGKPVIACRNQGIEDIIRHGENGWLIQPGNLDEMIAALSTLLGDAELRQRIGLAARQTSEAELTLLRQAERLNETYRACLGTAQDDEG
jgi:teichuronic acid biosynthesis glycosyltransferase TuaC